VVSQTYQLKRAAALLIQNLALLLTKHK